MSGQQAALLKNPGAALQLRAGWDVLKHRLRVPGTSVLSLIGPAAKWAVFVLLALNIRSFPLMWHARILHYLYRWHFRRFLWWALRRPGGDDRFIQLSCPVGKNPLEIVGVIQGIATVDDCDIFGHLSNSSYAKTLDIARFQFLVNNILPWYGEKGTTALGGSHYAFIKEILPLRRYEMRTCFGGWDDNKWLYLVTYFVSYPKKKGRSRGGASVSPNAKPPSPLPAAMLPEGAVLHCVSVSRYCLKMKRLTVPPTVGLSMSGFGGTKEIGWARWNRKEELRKSGKLADMVRGAWAEEIARSPEQGGWGLHELEAERLKGMEACGKMAGGLDMLKASPAPMLSN